jgi:aspartate aminotransferase
MLKAFRQRHDFVVEALNRIPGVVCLPADGTFYCFPYVQAIIDSLDGIADDVELAEYLLDKAGVALVPGTAFGAPGYLRLSFATGMETLQAALERLTNALTD